MTLWIGFHIFVFIMLALDLGVFHKEDHEVSIKESLTWTGIWILLALVFAVGVHYFIGAKESFEFLTAYTLEKSLSVDNIFVMTIIFSFFKVEKKYQHRVLFWGILGALVMRMVFILGGVAIIQKFNFVLYFFGAFLVYTGIKMLVSHDADEMNPEDGFIYKFCKKHLRMTDVYHGHDFFVMKNGLRYFTPLFLVLILIESTDLIFAVDSIPATLSVTSDSFIAYTSNIFAILGLRSLYFAFSGVVGLFRYLSYALSFVLIFIGLKMLIVNWYHISTAISLSVVLGAIFISIVLSIAIPEEK